MKNPGKLLMAALLVYTLSVGALAENIQLADGKVLVDAKVISQSGARVSIRYSEGLISVLKTNLPENLRSQYPVFADKPVEVKKPVRAVPVKDNAVAKEEKNNSGGADPEMTEEARLELEKSRAKGTASRLAYEYFGTRYKMMGARTETSLKMEDPTPVSGWTGRWRLHGFATLRYYRDVEANQNLIERERQLYDNPELTRKKIDRILANESFIRSELVEFDADVDKLDTEPEISVMIR